MYLTLTATDLIDLRRERLVALEADLHRARLQLEEQPPESERDAVSARIAELERRVAVHAAALTPPLPEGQVVDEPDAEPVSANGRAAS